MTRKPPSPLRLQISTARDDPTDAFLPSVRGVVFDVMSEDEVSYHCRVIDTRQATAAIKPAIGDTSFGIPKSYLQRGLAVEVRRPPSPLRRIASALKWRIVKWSADRAHKRYMAIRMEATYARIYYGDSFEVFPVTVYGKIWGWYRQRREPGEPAIGAPVGPFKTKDEAMP